MPSGSQIRVTYSVRAGALRSKRFTMVLHDLVVARLNVEASVLDVTCSAAEAILDD